MTSRRTRTAAATPAAVSTGSETGSDAGTGKLSLADLLEREGEVAADYLEGLLDIIDADGDIDMDVEGIGRSSRSSVTDCGTWSAPTGTSSTRSRS